MGAWYANPDPTFQPAMRIISSITQADRAVITTSFDHDYVDGLIVRLYVPKEYGMYQIDKKSGVITVLSDDTFRLDINTNNYDAFSIPADARYLPVTALCIPIANTLNDYNVAVRNVT